MPHDVKNNPLKIGDTVTLTFRVMDVQQSERDCNVTLLTLDQSGTNQSHLPMLACNSRLCDRVEF